MTAVNLTSFIDEVVKIKVAEEVQREYINPSELGHMMRNAAVGAGAFGLGTGVGGLALKYGLPELASKLTTSQKAALVSGAGLLSLAGTIAFSKMIQRNKELARGKD